MSDLCIVCEEPVRQLQHGITCDICDRWQHRICNTGISRIDYFKARKRLIILEFICRECQASQTVQDTTLYISLLSDTALESPSRDNTVESPSRDLTVELDTTNPHTAHTADTSIDIEDTMDVNIDPFDVTRNGAGDTSLITERSLAEAALSNTVIEDSDTVMYEVIEEGTTRKRKKLVSSDGFSYCVKKTTSCSVQWRCSLRRKGNICYASVSQKGDIFAPGQAHHTHPADPLMKKRVLLKRDIRQEAVRDLSAGRLVDDRMISTFETSDFNLSRPTTLVRQINRVRQKIRPKEPKSLDFEAGIGG